MKIEVHNVSKPIEEFQQHLQRKVAKVMESEKDKEKRKDCIYF